MRQIKTFGSWPNVFLMRQIKTHTRFRNKKPNEANKTLIP